MRRDALLLVGVAVAVLIAACQTEPTTSPVATGIREVAKGSSCMWTPTATFLDPGQKQLFQAQSGCSGFDVELDPTSADYGFSAGCSAKTTTTGTNGWFWLHNCDETAAAYVYIKDGETLIQTIEVNTF